MIPLAIGRSVVCRSVDHRTVVIVDADTGHTRELRFAAPAEVSPLSDKDAILVQVGRRVSAVNLPENRQVEIFRTSSVKETVHVVANTSVYYSFLDAVARGKTFRRISGETGRTLFRKKFVKSVLGLYRGRLICLTGRKRVRCLDGSLTISRPRIIAFDSQTGRERWRFRLGSYLRDSVQMGRYLLVLDGNRRVVSIDCSTGKQDAEYVPSDGRVISAVAGRGNEFACSVFDPSVEPGKKQSCVFVACEVPGLRVVSENALTVRPPVQFCFSNGYLIAKSLERTACLQVSSGREFWGIAGDVYWSRPSGGRLFYSCTLGKSVSAGVRFLGSVEIATGAEDIVYVEKF